MTREDVENKVITSHEHGIQMNWPIHDLASKNSSFVYYN